MLALPPWKDANVQPEEFRKGHFVTWVRKVAVTKAPRGSDAGDKHHIKELWRYFTLKMQKITCWPPTQT
jgi:hypothetical protein